MSNPFLKLGLEVKFDISRSQIESAYMAKQKELHLSGASEDEFIALNNAYIILKDPISRSYLIVQLFGGKKYGDDSKAIKFMFSIHEVSQKDKAGATNAVISEFKSAENKIKLLKLPEDIDEFRILAVLMHYCDSFIKNTR